MQKIFFLDTFTNDLFSGNPAAVCPLDTWPPDSIMQSIANENNLSETAFFVPVSEHQFEIRWFTPTTEVDLCGHATLASAQVLFSHLGYKYPSITFISKSGPLHISKENKRITLDFPGRDIEQCEATSELLDCFITPPSQVLRSGTETYIAVFDSESDVASYQPDFSKLEKVDRCVNITAQGNSCDFVSRFFGPNIGLPEDSVTGSAHCGLAIFWSRKLGKTEDLHAVQLSRRTGEVFCSVNDERVYLSGQTRLYLRGEIYID